MKLIDRMYIYIYIELKVQSKNESKSRLMQNVILELHK